MSVDLKAILVEIVKLVRRPGYPLRFRNQRQGSRTRNNNNDSSGRGRTERRVNQIVEEGTREEIEENPNDAPSTSNIRCPGVQFNHMRMNTTLRSKSVDGAVKLALIDFL